MAKYEADTIEAPPVVVNMEYDTPPAVWVPGTKVPKDTAPEDMTEPEYVQWMYENWTPFWAIKKNLLLRYPPVLSGLEPSTAAIGDESFRLYISGEKFVQNESVIVFASQDEPTTFEEDGRLSTGVNMDVWHGPDVIQVQVRNGAQVSEPLDFTFTGDAPAAAEADADYEYDEPDDDGKPAKKSKKKK